MSFEFVQITESSQEHSTSDEWMKREHAWIGKALLALQGHVCP